MAFGSAAEPAVMIAVRPSRESETPGAGHDDVGDARDRLGRCAVGPRHLSGRAAGSVAIDPSVVDDDHLECGRAEPDEVASG